jgi:threonine aldolase
MLERMMKASVGDMIFGEDPEVNELERMAAEMFGMEGALFCPSGTMTNQIAIKAHTRPAMRSSAAGWPTSTCLRWWCGI